MGKCRFRRALEDCLLAFGELMEGQIRSTELCTHLSIENAVQYNEQLAAVDQRIARFNDSAGKMDQEWQKLIDRNQ